MILIIGGAYQGKLDYAAKTFGLRPADICDCSTDEPDFDKKCIYHLEQYVLACVRENRDAAAFFEANRDRWQDSILISNDISAGVVPIEPEIRQWREATGRLLNHLSAQATQVTRLFCGLPQRLK